MSHAALDSAYATLGLRRGASAAAVKRRYRALVRQWHPDRFASDPQGVTEATLMLKAINRAYKMILEHRAPDVGGAAPARPDVASHQSTRVDPRVTAQQRDEIVDAIRHSESLLATGFDDGVGSWPSRAASIVVVSMIAAMSWKSGLVAVCVLPLLCIWFPDAVGALGARDVRPAPAWLIWLVGWAILLPLLFGVGVMWLRSP